MDVAPILITERLRLRPHRRDDFAALVDLYASDRSRFIGGPLPEKDVWQGFMSAIGQWPILGYGAWAIERIEDGEYIGQIGLNQPIEFPEPELGWLLFAGFEGSGYAYEAALRTREFAAMELGMTGLVSYVDPGNNPSLRLAGRLGAVRDLAAPTPNDDPCLVFRHP